MTQAIWNGHVIAESDATVEVEGNAYFPPESIKREFFQDSDRRVAEVDLNQLMRNNNLRFIDRAVAGNKPVRPDLLVNLFMALILGVFGGTLLAFGMEYLDTTRKLFELTFGCIATYEQP